MIVAAAVCTAHLVAALAGALREHYVFAGTGARMAAAIESKSYDEPDGRALADALTRDLNAIAHDAHLRVAAEEPAPTAASAAAAKPTDDHGFGEVKVLPNGIGYIDLRGFVRPDDAVRAKVADAFRRVHAARAVIIDLRANGGGNPETVALVASYLLDRPTLLAEMRHRESGSEPIMSPPRPEWALRHGVRVDLLTSAKTFSAGEGFAFILQHLGRVRVIGERTAGAAHAGRAYPLPCGFQALIPNTAVVLPGTNEDWEGRGVQPDIDVAATNALDFAIEHLR